MNYEQQIDEILTAFIMHYDQRIKIGNKRNIEATERAKQALIELVAEARVDDLMKFDEWLRERSHLDLRMVAGKRVRDHIWLEIENIKRIAALSSNKQGGSDE